MEYHTANSSETTEQTVTEASDLFLTSAEAEISSAMDAIGLDLDALGRATAESIVIVGAALAGSVTAAAVASIILPILPVAIPTAMLSAAIGGAGLQAGIYAWNKLTDPEYRI